MRRGVRSVQNIRSVLYFGDILLKKQCIIQNRQTMGKRNDIKIDTESEAY